MQSVFFHDKRVNAAALLCSLLFFFSSPLKKTYATEITTTENSRFDKQAFGILDYYELDNYIVLLDVAFPYIAAAS